MIKIDEAIELSKNMENVSNGGSACYDFGDVVLVKYSIPLEYRDDARENEEQIKEVIDAKVSIGVNIPRHLEIKRTKDDKKVYCYVLQEKAKGINGNDLFKEVKAKDKVTIDEIVECLKYISNIPLEHYVKLAADSTEVLEMGFERQPKNFFYDKEIGFSFIDFLEYKPEEVFDKDNPYKIFKTCKFVCPDPINTVPYFWNLKNEDQEKTGKYENIIRTKRLVSFEKGIPNFEKYKKFYILGQVPSFKEYLTDNELYDGDLKSLNEEDYKLFNELCEIIENNIVKSILEGNNDYYNVCENSIRIDTQLFYLEKVWLLHKDNKLIKEPDEEYYDYNLRCEKELRQIILQNIYNKLQKITNEYSLEFIAEYEENNKKRTY